MTLKDHHCAILGPGKKITDAFWNSPGGPVVKTLFFQCIQKQQQQQKQNKRQLVRSNGIASRVEEGMAYNDVGSV